MGSNPIPGSKVKMQNTIFDHTSHGNYFVYVKNKCRIPFFTAQDIKTSQDGRVLKALDLRSNGEMPIGFRTLPL